MGPIGKGVNTIAKHLIDQRKVPGFKHQLNYHAVRLENFLDHLRATGAPEHVIKEYERKQKRVFDALKAPETQMLKRNLKEVKKAYNDPKLILSPQ